MTSVVFMINTYEYGLEPFQQLGQWEFESEKLWIVEQDRKWSVSVGSFSFKRLIGPRDPDFDTCCAAWAAAVLGGDWECFVQEIFEKSLPLAHKTGHWDTLERAAS